MNKACAFCKIGFETGVAKKRFCSSKCQMRSWRRTKAEHCAAYNRARYQPEIKSEFNRAWNKAHPDYAAEWKKANPHRMIVQRQKRRARNMGAAGSFTPTEFDLIVKKQKGRCAECGKRRRLTADHIVPLAGGGTNFAYNIQGLCTSCNCAKGARIVDYAAPSLFDRKTA